MDVFFVSARAHGVKTSHSRIHSSPPVSSSTRLERAVRALARCGCVADLFLTLSRGYHAPQLPAVLEAVEAIFGEEAPGAALTLVDEHTGEYGTGMMIMHWRVAEGWWWERAWAARAASAPLADRLAAEGPRAFRKPRNVRAARG